LMFAFEQVRLPIGPGQAAITVDDQRRVEWVLRIPRVPFEKPADDGDAGLGRQILQRGGRRTVDRLGHGQDLGAYRIALDEALRKDNQVAAARSGSSHVAS